MRSTKTKRLDIQALRAIAVLSVVLYHLWPGRLSGGFMGVDVFFVISGYLMTKTLMRDVHPVLTAKRKFHALGKYVSDFYARRIKRLLPAASVTLLATLVAVYATGSYELIIKTARQIGASALFFQNRRFGFVFPKLAVGIRIYRLSKEFRTTNGCSAFLEPISGRTILFTLARSSPSIIICYS